MKSDLMIEDPKNMANNKVHTKKLSNMTSHRTYLTPSETEHPGFKQELSNERNVTIYSVHCHRELSLIQIQHKIFVLFRFYLLQSITVFSLLNSRFTQTVQFLSNKLYFFRHFYLLNVYIISSYFDLQFSKETQN